MSTLPVLAAVDGSDDSLRALDWGLTAARLREATLHVVHVRQYAPWGQPDVLVAGPPEPAQDPVLDQARSLVESKAERPFVKYLAPGGPTVAVLPELGADAQLMVLGSRGRGGFAGLLLGSNSLAAARDADCPVVVVPRPGREVHEGPPPAPGPRVVVGLHIDSPAEATLAFAFAEADRRGARLHVIAVYPWPPVQLWPAPGELMPPAVDEDAVDDEIRTQAMGLLAIHRERHPDVHVDLSTPPGDAAGHLVAASRDAELVAVGRHRRRLLAPARMIGSVTQAVLLHAGCPVAVIPPSADAVHTDG
ncbi:universal stress protein [Streptomyces sp. NPDC002573]|uniref:universal stress protein n=1 Tax=Streptomyces sp. NPDC002573 TaxID=3364651 RepID=UPI0036A7B762